nr:hypothetical protein [Terricaulis sp.]
MDTGEAKGRLAHLKFVGRAILWGITVAVVIAGVLKIGTDSGWIFLRDVGRPWAEWHWGLWRDIGATIAAGFAGAAAISFSVRYVALKNVLNQLIQDNSTHIAHQDNSTETHNHTHTTNHHSVDLGVKEDVARVGEDVKNLAQLLEDKQANPEHLRQLHEFLQYAQNERILELKNQLSKYAELF